MSHFDSDTCWVFPQGRPGPRLRLCSFSTRSIVMPRLSETRGSSVFLWAVFFGRSGRSNQSRANNSTCASTFGRLAWHCGRRARRRCPGPGPRGRRRRVTVCSAPRMRKLVSLVRDEPRDLRVSVGWLVDANSPTSRRVDTHAVVRRSAREKGSKNCRPFKLTVDTRVRPPVGRATTPGGRLVAELAWTSTRTWTRCPGRWT